MFQTYVPVHPGSSRIVYAVGHTLDDVTESDPLPARLVEVQTHAPASARSKVSTPATAASEAFAASRNNATASTTSTCSATSATLAPATYSGMARLCPFSAIWSSVATAAK